MKTRTGTSRRLVSAAAMVWAVVLLLTVSRVAATAEEQAAAPCVDSDAALTVVEIIKKRGYDVETHKVTTADRYVLTMYRLPRSYQESSQQQNASQGSPAAKSKPVVYLIHGLIDSSYAYVLNFRTQSLAFLLADAGYDVWLGNNRGNTWSREHLDLSVNDPRFWDFSWQEMALFDMPAMLNYVLATSKRATLSYVGHSEGTMQAFAGFSINQELAQKVSYFGALAPVAYVGGATSPILVTLAKTFVDKFVQAFGVSEFLQKSPVVQDLLAKNACAFADGLPCNTLMNALTGPSKNINSSRVHVYVTQMPAGTSVKNLAHLAQGIRDNTFRKYDYGCACPTWSPLVLCPKMVCKNKAVYGSFAPPNWDLANVKYPRTALFTGKQDWLSTPSDITKIRNQLPKGTIVFDKQVADYAHLDFIWGFNAPEKIYNDLITQIKFFEGMGY